MWKKLTTLLNSPSQPKELFIRILTPKGTEQTLSCLPGDNLMDVTNKTVNENLNIYGLCNKQLACTTCSVDIEKYYERLPQPTEEELDILYGLAGYRDRCTRMACQIWVREELDGMVVRIPRKGGQ